MTTDPKRDPRQDLLDAIDSTYAYGVLGYASAEVLLAAYDASRAVSSSGRAALLHETADTEAPLSPYYEHPECGFHWHGRDGMDIPVRDGQPVCPRCELAKVEKKLAYVQRMRDEVGEECKRRGRIKLEQAERIVRLERELRRVAAEEQPAETQAPEPETEEQRVRAHVTTLHLIGEQLTGIESWMWNHLADVRDAEEERQAAAEYARALATPPSAEAAAYIRERLERPRPDDADWNSTEDATYDQPPTERPVVGEQPDTQETDRG